MIARALVALALLSLVTAQQSQCDTTLKSYIQTTPESAHSDGTCVTLAFECSSDICVNSQNGLRAANNTATIYFTDYSTHTINKIDVVYGDTQFLTTSGIVQISQTAGADGIIGNPAQAGELLIGGQSSEIYRVNISNGAVISTSVIGVAYHLSAVSVDRLFYTNVNTDQVHIVDIAADGSLSNARHVPGDRGVTTVIVSPTMDFYTTAGPGGEVSSFGSITFQPNVENPTSFTTTELGQFHCHSGQYDPFSQKVILFGGGYITQVDLAGNQYSQLYVGNNIQLDQGGVDGKGHIFVADNNGYITQVDLAGNQYSQLYVGNNIQLDQGGVDGKGHIFVADNNGYLIYVSYRSDPSKKVENGFVAKYFLMNYLDDVAPLIGLGGTC